MGFIMKGEPSGDGGGQKGLAVDQGKVVDTAGLPGLGSHAWFDRRGRQRGEFVGVENFDLCHNSIGWRMEGKGSLPPDWRPAAWGVRLRRRLRSAGGGEFAAAVPGPAWLWRLPGRTRAGS